MIPITNSGIKWNERPKHIYQDFLYFTSTFLRAAKNTRPGLVGLENVKRNGYMTCPPKSDPVILLGSKGGFHG
jgi:hypothetical protein